MKLYEIAVVLHPDLEIDLERATGKVEKVIDAAKGKVVKKDNWGKRKLAYKIKKQDWGIYVFYQVQLDPSKVAQIDSSFRITSEIMRYIIVNLDDTKYLKKTKPSEKSIKPKEKKDSLKTASAKADDKEKK